jgi:hypothetical protein
MHVALVGRRTVHRDRSERRIASGLERDRTADVIEPQAAPFDSDMRRKQTGFARSRIQLTPKAVLGSMRALARIALNYKLMVSCFTNRF